MAECGDNRKVKLRGPLSMVLVVLLAACTAPVLDISDPLSISPANTPISVDSVARNNADRRLAEEQHGPILASFGGEYFNTKAERMVARIVGRLIEVSDDRSQVYEITLLNTPTVNAFALPGGYLYVTRGLLALANDSAELAGVIAHEMAHVELNHGIKRQQKQEEEELVSRVVNDVLTDSSNARASLVRGKIRFAQFTRNQELEADKIGIDLLGKAGFDPYAAARFQRSMGRYIMLGRDKSGQSSALDFLASHPTAPQREQFALGHAERFGPQGTGTRDRDRYLTGIDGLFYGDTPDQGYIRGAEFLHPELGIAFKVPQGYNLSNSKQAVLASGPDESALRFDSVDVPKDTPLERYLTSGWVNGLDASSVQLRNLNGLEVAFGKARDKGWQFDVALFRVGDDVFRMLTAMPTDKAKRLDNDAEFVRQNFRLLTAQERSSIVPLRLGIKTIDSNTSIRSNSTSMGLATTQPEALFRVLNGLSPTETLSRGQKIKIITQ